MSWEEVGDAGKVSGCSEAEFVEVALLSIKKSQGWYVGRHKDPRGMNELSGPIKYISMTESVNNIMQAHNTLLHLCLCAGI